MLELAKIYAISDEREKNVNKNYHQIKWQYSNYRIIL